MDMVAWTSVHACSTGAKITEEEDERVWTTPSIESALEALGIERDCSGDGTESFLAIKESQHEETRVASCIGEISSLPGWRGLVERALQADGIDPGSRPAGWYIVTKL
jgi:hypothetical protein